MSEVGSAEFSARARFRDLIRSSAKVVKSLRDVRDAREDASGDLDIHADEAQLKKIPRDIERAVESADPDGVEVEADLGGFRRGLQRGVDAAVRGVEAEVPVVPETAEFKRGVERAIAKFEATQSEVKIRTALDQTGVQEGLRRLEVTTASGKYKVEVPADLKGGNLVSEVSRMVREAEARAGSVDVEVKANDTGLRGQVRRITSMAGAGQEIEVPVHADTSPLERLKVSLGGVLNVGGALSGVMGLLKWPALITGAQLAAGALSALAAAGIGAISALGPLTGLIGSLPALGAAVGGVMGSVRLAFMGVSDAVKAYGQSQKTAGTSAVASAKADETAAKARKAALQAVARAQQGVADAQKRSADLQVQAVKRVQSAEKGLQSALRASQKAQEDLTKARADAARQLVDLRKQVSRGALDEERAVLNVDEARARLNEVMADGEATELDRRSAILDLKDAENDLADVQQRRADDARALSDAERKGVEGSDLVIGAKERVAEADQAILDSQEELASAQAGIAEAQIEGARMVADAQLQLVSALEQLQDAATQTGAAGAAAMDPFAAALADLPPSAQAFVRYLVSLQPLLTKLRTIAADNLFPGLTVGLSNVVSLMPLAERYVGAFSRAVGDAAAEISTLVFDPQFVSDLDSIGAQGLSVFRQLTSAVKPLVKALAGVGAEAAPVTQFLGDYATNLVKLVSGQLEAGRSSGAMAKFFSEARFVLQAVLDTIVRLANGLVKIGTIAYQVLGRELVGRLDEAGRKFADFVNSADGQNKIRKFFEDAKPAIDETLGLIGDVVKMFFRLSDSKELAPLIRQIREDFLPVVEKLLSGDNSAFAKGLIDLVTQLGKVFASLGGPGGPLMVFVETLARMAEAVAWLADNVPGFTTFVGALTLLIGVSKGVSFVGWITGGSQLVKLFSKKNADGVSLFSKALGKLGPVAGKASSLVVTAFTSMGRGIAAAGAWMLANPIVLAIVAIIAVIALLIWKWDWVKEHVVAAWQWLYDKAYEIFPGIAAAVGVAVDWIKDKWDGVVDWFGGIVDGLLGVWDRFTEPIRKAWDVAWDAVASNPIAQKIGDLVGNVVEIVKRVWGLTPLGFILNNWETIWNGLVQVTSVIWGAISAAVGAGVGFVADVVSSMLDVMLPIWTAVWNAALTVLSVVWDTIVSTVSTGAMFFLTVWNGLLEAIIWAWDNGWRVVSSVLSAAWGAISSVVGTLVGWLTAVWSGLVNTLQTIWSVAWNAISTVVSTVLGTIRSIISTSLNTISSIWSSIWNGLAGPLSSAWNLIKAVAANGVNGVISILNVLIKGANAVLSKLPGGFSIGEITYRAAFEEGGLVPDGVVPGVGGTDKVRALMKPGEYVITTESAKSIGYSALEWMNRFGRVPGPKTGPTRRFARGGRVDRYSARNRSEPVRMAKGGKVVPISAAPSYQRFAKGGIVDQLGQYIPQVGALQGLLTGGSPGDIAKNVISGYLAPLVKVANFALDQVAKRDQSPVGRTLAGVGRGATTMVQTIASTAIGKGVQSVADAIEGSVLGVALGHLPVFHDGGGAGFSPSKDMLALLQRGEGVASVASMVRMEAALGGSMMGDSNVGPRSTIVNVNVYNPVAEPAEESIHREMQKLATHGILPPVEAAS